MGFAKKAFVAAGVGFAAAALVGCGSSGRLLSGSEASTLRNELNHVSIALTDDQCESAEQWLADFQNKLASLGGVNSTLLDNLTQGASTTEQLTENECRTPVHVDQAAAPAHHLGNDHHADLHQDLPDADHADGQHRDRACHDADLLDADGHLHSSGHDDCAGRDDVHGAAASERWIGPAAGIVDARQWRYVLWRWYVLWGWQHLRRHVDGRQPGHRCDQQRYDQHHDGHDRHHERGARVLMNTASFIGGRYRVEGRIGVGGMSTVMLARRRAARARGGREAARRASRRRPDLRLTLPARGAGGRAARASRTSFRSSTPALIRRPTSTSS